MRITSPFKRDKIWIDWRTVGLFATNSHVVICPQTKEAVLIDGSGEFPVLKKMFEAYEGIQIKYYLQTHAHLDHVAALSDLCEWHEAPILLHRDEEMLYKLCGNFCHGLDQWTISRTSPGDQIDDGPLVKSMTEVTTERLLPLP